MAGTQVDNEHPEELIVFLHGTFATAQEDVGFGWWQRGSDFWKWMRENLPQGMRLNEGGTLFRWSGRNSESERERAAQLLLKYMLRLQREHQLFHLIAHSHAGSVVWNALCRNTAREFKAVDHAANDEELNLTCLRSWTTVGTPFLQFEPLTRTAFWWIVTSLNYAIAVAILLTIVPALFTEHYSPMSVLDSALSAVIRFADPRFASRDASIRAIVFMSVMLAFLLMIALILGFVDLVSRVLAPPRWSRRQLTHRRRIERSAARRYGTRWLGIWSLQDEAVLGLKTTLHLQGKMIPPLSTSGFGLFQWVTQLPYLRVIDRLRPHFDRIIWDSIKRTLQGNDQPELSVSDVHFKPGSWNCESSPFDGALPLPDAVSTELIVKADQAASQRPSTYRKLLGELALSGFNIVPSHADHLFSGEELVHTSYFDHPAVRELILLHVATASPYTERASNRKDEPPELRDWFYRTKAFVAKGVEQP